MNNRLKLDNNQHEPNLLKVVPLNVWRDVYKGRWAKLRKIQQVEFVLELLFFILFIGGFCYADYVRGGDSVELILAFGIVGAVLIVFFLLLRRCIR